MSIFNQFINSAARQVGRNVANDVYYRKAASSRASWKQWIVALAILFGFVSLLDYAKTVSNQESQVSSQKITVPDTYNGHTVYTGKRGGRYYYGKGGKKVYIK